MEIIIGIGVAGFNCIIGYLILSYALNKTNRIFYSAFVSGIFFRTVVLTLTGFAIYRFTELNLAVFLVSSVVGYIFLSFIEIWILLRY